MTDLYFHFSLFKIFICEHMLTILFNLICISILFDLFYILFDLFLTSLVVRKIERRELITSNNIWSRDQQKLSKEQYMKWYL